MSIPLHPALRTAIWAVAAPLGLYCIFLGLGMTPFFQRHFLYAHKINTLLWTDVNKPQQWGFARNQVTPFSLKTPDGESIYAWHILPLPLYLQNEASIESQNPGFSEDFTKTESFRLLKEDPESRLVLYCESICAGSLAHTGQNAGHIAQAIRPDSYHSLTDTSSYHVIAIDYRGFGHSTGVPSEAGVIQDASTLVEWAINVAGIPSSRIQLLGQSLGTAVVSGVAEKYALQGVEFAGITLVAGFSDLANLLVGYRIAGIFPVLAPFRVWPWLVRYLHRFIVDKWHSADRLANIVRHTKTRLRINLIHAKDDRDIPWTEDNKLFRAAAQETVGILDEAEFDAWKEQRTIRKGDDAFVTTWMAEPNIIIRQELFPHGGHNDIMGYAPVALGIMRAFDLHGTTYTED
ncbi:Hydrolase-4 domain-containing protein [Fusarium falciforme]|uniref:Hydrolase-4 domain-containing protein n=1 Tax=Fusarium falciforme TaxID=195108 RepID=UPI002301228D|nr:Hydrolase-4 domain-containing protein [Fusarium falciforme]WAO84467.1 Hydrolase-4 domain-containing protein [Fusarium falciforme]